MIKLRYVMRPFVLGQFEGEMLSEDRPVLQYCEEHIDVKHGSVWSDWQDVPTESE